MRSVGGGRRPVGQGGVGGGGVAWGEGGERKAVGRLSPMRDPCCMCTSRATPTPLWALFRGGVYGTPLLIMAVAVEAAAAEAATAAAAA